MAKLTLTNLASLVNTTIDADKQLIDASDYEFDTDTYSGLIVKIGKQIMEDSTFTDRLPELDGENLPFGTDIEEYFINLALPIAHDPTGASALAPQDPVFEDAAYSKSLGRKTFKETLRDNMYEKALLGQTEASAIAAQVLKRWSDQRTLFRYSAKKELLGNLIEKVDEAQSDNSDLTMIHTQAKPADVETAEAFIKKVKERVTELSEFITDTNNIGAVPAKSDSLILYIKGSDIIPNIDVEALAGAFNPDKVQIPVEVRIVEDFGTVTGDDAGKVYAILADTRIARLHSHRLATESERNATGEFTNMLAHETYIAYISKFVNVNLFKTA